VNGEKSRANAEYKQALVVRGEARPISRLGKRVKKGASSALETAMPF